MRVTVSHLIWLCFIVGILSDTSCKKDPILTTGGILKFSVDTLKFDTVFTTQGSFTMGINIYNPQGERITVSSVRLSQGNTSYFHLNVDGFQGNAVSNIEIAPHDSVYVFATVKIDPTIANTPFVVEDSLIATLNGKNYYLPITAYGQNAYYIVDSTLKTQTWKTDKPYVIIHNAFVDVGNTLTIPSACRVYVHADSRLFVFGTLKINEHGTKNDDSVIFQGDRLDRAYFGYQGYPGEWGGIYFDSRSTNNVINYTVLKNCGNGTSVNGYYLPPAAIEVATDSVHSSSAPQLLLNHTRIYNCIGYGILSFQGTIHAENCLIHSCGAEALALLQGGNDTFNFCTFVCNGTYAINHTADNPTAAILNYYDIDNVNYYSGDLNVVLRNCILWGSNSNEVFCNKKNVVGGTTAYNLIMSHCLIKSMDAGSFPNYIDTTGSIFNTDPLFANAAQWNFHPTASSPMNNKGIAIPAITDDIEGYSPRASTPTIGCYEQH
jgi:hypothetical protein